MLNRREGHLGHSLPLPQARPKAQEKKIQLGKQMQVELRGEKYQKLHSIGSRGLNSVWSHRDGRVLGLLPKAVNSHGITLNKSEMPFCCIMESTGALGVHIMWYNESLPQGMESGWLWEELMRREGGIQVNSVHLLWGIWPIVLPLTETGRVGEGWGSRGTSAMEIAFGYPATLLQLQMNSAESGWQGIAGQEQKLYFRC